MMFSAFCPTHDSTVLLTRRNVMSFWNSDDGPVIQWKCSCGHEGFLDRNGTSADCGSCADQAVQDVRPVQDVQAGQPGQDVQRGEDVDAARVAHAGQTGA